MSDATSPVVRADLDGLALKPTETDLERRFPPVDVLVVDYEGDEHVPEPDRLAALADRHGGSVRLTTPVRAAGYDPLGDDDGDERVPAAVGRVLVAGTAAYLDDVEADRAVAPRLRAARQRHPDAWVGTEGVERIALAVGGPQFELLSRTTAADVSALRDAGFDEEVALYAPVVLSDDDDTILDAVGPYVARRRPVALSLSDDARVDSRATGDERDLLSRAARDYALVGSPADVRERVDRLREAGVDVVVGHPARGLDAILADE